MRSMLWIVTTVCLTACAGPQESAPRVDVKKLQEQWLEAIDQNMADLREDIEREYAPKSAFNLSNSLRQSFLTLESRLAQLEARDRQIEPEELKVLMDPVRESLGEVVTRVDRLESDMNATLEDIYGMREEVRGVLTTLEAYRNATRATLELQRDVLSRQLRALDEALAPPTVKSSDG